MKTDILTVTHNRPEFAPWTAWVVSKTKGRGRWIVVDSSDTPRPELWAGAEYHHSPHANIPEKREHALSLADTEWVSWQDDDDWNHPNKIQILLNLAQPDSVAVGSLFLWHVNLMDFGVKRLGATKGVPYLNSTINRREAGVQVAWGESVAVASDALWLETLCQQPYVSARLPLTYLLNHDRNIINTARGKYRYGLDDIRDTVGRAAFGQSLSRMRALAGALWS